MRRSLIAGPPRVRPGRAPHRGMLLAPRRVEALLQRGEHAHDAEARGAVRARRAPLAHAVHEVLALELERFAVRYARAPDVPRARDVLAVGRGVLVEALVVDGHLPLEVHVVEGRHPPRADDGEAALLVRVEPGEVQVGRQAGREAEEPEDDVLHAAAHVGLTARLDLVRLLLGQVQHDGDVVGAERPQRVLVGAQLPEVQAVGVDVVDVAELTVGGDPLEHRDARVVLEQVTDHEDPVRRGGRGDGPLGVGDGLGERLLDEAVLAGGQHALGQRRVGRHRGGEHDGIDALVREHVVERRGASRARVRRTDPGQRRLVGVAQPRHLAVPERREIPREVGAPIAQPRDAHPDAAHAGHPTNRGGDAARAAGQPPIRRTSASTTRSPARPSP